VLDPERVDLADLALALEDHSGEHVWFLDTVTGEVSPRFGAVLELRSEVEAEADGRLVAIDPLPTAVGYHDMEEFVRRVRDARTREVLERAIGGQGAFRRFKDALLEYPRLRRSWFAFHDARGERRAIEWLAERWLVDRGAADEALLLRPEPAPADLPGLLDAEAVAHRVARDLQRLYRDRLRSVLMIGAWARGDAHPESELKLLVVLDRVRDRWEEKTRMDRIMWRHSIRNDTVVTEIPVSEEELDRATEPLLARALSEAVRVA
jgi:predicted nucleotidyltransferase